MSSYAVRRLLQLIPTLLGMSLLIFALVRLLPGDVSASDRFYARDITPPFVLQDGHIRVPTGAGLGVDVLTDILDEVTTSVETVRP